MHQLSFCIVCRSNHPGKFQLFLRNDISSTEREIFFIIKTLSSLYMILSTREEEFQKICLMNNVKQQTICTWFTDSDYLMEQPQDELDVTDSITDSVGSKLIRDTELCTLTSIGNNGGTCLFVRTLECHKIECGIEASLSMPTSELFCSKTHLCKLKQDQICS